MDLRGERRMALVLLELSLDRSLEGIERGLQAPGRRLDYTCVGHASPRRSAHCVALGIQKSLAWQDVINGSLRARAAFRQRRERGFQRPQHP
jgi:hypothetical protein